MKGITIRNFKFLPPEGFAAITFFPFIFVNPNTSAWENPANRKYLINHERIHLTQQLEMLVVLFYVWYVLEYLFRLVQYKGNKRLAYRNISFEREAYSNDRNIEYRKTRKPFSWVKYLIK